MKYTDNYGLKKPDLNDYIEIDDLNENADIIDDKLKEHENELDSKETPAGAQAKADQAEQNAKEYTDQQVADIEVPVTSVNDKTGDVIVTKEDVGLGNVDNVQQASKTEHDQLAADFTAHQADFSSYQFGDRPYTSTVSKTYYLDQANGSDENDGESPETAFQSWEKVYSKIPIFIHHSYTVKIIGDYDGQILLYNIHAHQSEFTLEGHEGNAENHTVTSSITPVPIRNATHLTIQHLTIEAPNDTNVINMKSTTETNVNNCILKHIDVGYYNFPIVWIDYSLVRIQDCMFESNENGDSGIYASDPSIVSSHDNSGVAGRYGLRARRGSVIAKSGSQPTGTDTDEMTAAGGVIR